MNEITKEALEAAASRIMGNRDFQMVMNGRLMELNELILSTPMDQGVPLSNALHSYHATKELQDYITELARDAQHG